MERLMKLKIYDNKENRFLEFNEELVKWFGNTLLWEWCVTIIDNSWRYKYIQFTWLKDKNWKEIYEGDIVKYKTFEKFEDDNWNSVVKFKAIYRIEYSQLTRKLRWTNYSIDLCNKWCIARSIEIIWNIYENTNLIEKNA